MPALRIDEAFQKAFCIRVGEREQRQ